MTREEWLEERKNGIGGSDAATILGLNPYKSNETPPKTDSGIVETNAVNLLKKNGDRK